MSGSLSGSRLRCSVIGRLGRSGATRVQRLDAGAAQQLGRLELRGGPRRAARPRTVSRHRSKDLRGLSRTSSPSRSAIALLCGSPPQSTVCTCSRAEPHHELAARGSGRRRARRTCASAGDARAPRATRRQRVGATTASDSASGPAASVSASRGRGRVADAADARPAARTTTPSAGDEVEQRRAAPSQRVGERGGPRRGSAALSSASVERAAAAPGGRSSFRRRSTSRSDSV